MQAVEFAVLNWVQSHLRCAFLDIVLPAISRTCNYGEIWIVLMLVLLAIKRYRCAGAAVGFALVLHVLCVNLLLKPLVRRVRPFTVNTLIELLIAPPLDAGFPSGHTAVSFAVVFALHASGCWVWKPALAVAVVIAFSRVYLYVHWPSDVLAAALIGALLGCLAAWLARFAFGLCV